MYRDGRLSSIFVFNTTLSKGPALYPKTAHIKGESKGCWQMVCKVKYIESFLCLLRIVLFTKKKILLPVLSLWSYCLETDPQCPHSQICILDVNGDCVNPSTSDEHALGTSIQDSVMPFNWQSKFATGKACILNPQTIFMSLASHQQAKDTKVIKVSIGGGIWNLSNLVHVTCWEIAVVYENMVLFLDQERWNRSFFLFFHYISLAYAVKPSDSKSLETWVWEKRICLLVGQLQLSPTAFGKQFVNHLYWA